MKRASLKTAKVPVTSVTTHDVTDRLLSSDPESTPRITPAQPTPKRRVQPSESSPTIPPTPPLSPSSTVTSNNPATQPPNDRTADSITQALSQTRLALDALIAARTDSSARYDLGIRVRLDALAHHLEQVTQFIARQ